MEFYKISSKALSLDTAGAVAASQLFNLSDSNHVIVALDGVLQSGSCHSKFNRSLGVLAGQNGVDQAAAERVAAAHAIDDVQVVLLGEAELFLRNIIKHGAPAVVEGRVRFAQSDSNHLKTELVSQLLGNGFVALVVQAAAIDISCLGFDAEDILGIFLVGDADMFVLMGGRPGQTGTLASDEKCECGYVLRAGSYEGGL